LRHDVNNNLSLIVAASELDQFLGITRP